MRDRCPHEECGVGAGETQDWQSADLIERHRGIMVAGRALGAGFFIVDIEMPRRIGIKHRIGSVAWERSALVAGCGQPLNAFGAANLRFPRPDIFCFDKRASLPFWRAVNVTITRRSGFSVCAHRAVQLRDSQLPPIFGGHGRRSYHQRPIPPRSGDCCVLAFRVTAPRSAPAFLRGRDGAGRG